MSYRWVSGRTLCCTGVGTAACWPVTIDCFTNSQNSVLRHWKASSSRLCRLCHLCWASTCSSNQETYPSRFCQIMLLRLGTVPSHFVDRRYFCRPSILTIALYGPLKFLPENLTLDLPFPLEFIGVSHYAIYVARVSERTL